MHDAVAILDFGSQFAHLLARRVRELGCYCELLPWSAPAERLGSLPGLRGVVLSGGPHSVNDPGAPHLAPEVWELLRTRGVPVLGVCYGMQELAWAHGGRVEGGGGRCEYGRAEVRAAGETELLRGLGSTFEVWMSHGDRVADLPDGFRAVAATENGLHAAIDDGGRLHGVQFHPEVTHTPLGRELLRNFVQRVCGARCTWTPKAVREALLRRVREQVGPEEHVVGAVSGGVDSTVAAVLLQEAVGDRFHAIFVDTGLLREGEAAEVRERLGERLGLRTVDASERFLAALRGISDPEEKRRRIGATFVDVFEEEARALPVPAGLLLQGTLYPDVVESGVGSAAIKTHHNVGGLPDRMRLRLVEPLRELFKDEVRALGELLGLPRESVWRHPFPGPGLAIRVLGEVTRQACDTLRAADRIFVEELRASGDYDRAGQALAVLLPVRAVGVQGDHRTYERVVVLRAVQTSDFMTADWLPLAPETLGRASARITNEVPGVNRVCYDVSSKPPATIEWE